MNIDTARQLKEGDILIAVQDGLSGEIPYYVGQPGIVAFKDHLDSPFFGVKLNTGEITGHVLMERWERMNEAVQGIVGG